MTAPTSTSTSPRARLREFYLEEIDAWRRGDKATPGSPATGERYALRMREEVRRLEAALDELGDD